MFTEQQKKIMIIIPVFCSNSTSFMFQGDPTSQKCNRKEYGMELLVIASYVIGYHQGTCSASFNKTVISHFVS